MALCWLFVCVRCSGVGSLVSVVCGASVASVAVICWCVWLWCVVWFGVVWRSGGCAGKFLLFLETVIFWLCIWWGFLFFKIAFFWHGLARNYCFSKCVFFGCPIPKIFCFEKLSFFGTENKKKNGGGFPSPYKFLSYSLANFS